VLGAPDMGSIYQVDPDSSGRPRDSYASVSRAKGRSLQATGNVSRVIQRKESSTPNGGLPRQRPDGRFRSMGLDGQCGRSRQRRLRPVQPRHGLHGSIPCHWPSKFVLSSTPWSPARTNRRLV